MSNYSYWMFLGFINQLLTGGHRIVQDFGMKVWAWFHDRDWSLMNSEATGLGEKYRIQEKIGKLSIKHGSTFPFSTRMNKSSGVEWHCAGERKLDTSGVSCNSNHSTGWSKGEAPLVLSKGAKIAGFQSYLWYLLPTCNSHWKLRQVPLFWAPGAAGPMKVGLFPSKSNSRMLLTARRFNGMGFASVNSRKSSCWFWESRNS